MTTQELIQLLRPIFEEVFKSEGKLSAIEAVEVIENFKSKIQDEAIEKFYKKYNFLFERKTAEKARFNIANEFKNSQKTLVRCK